MLQQKFSTQPKRDSNKFRVGWEAGEGKTSEIKRNKKFFEQAFLLVWYELSEWKVYWTSIPTTVAVVAGGTFFKAQPNSSLAAIFLSQYLHFDLYKFVVGVPVGGAGERRRSIAMEIERIDAARWDIPPYWIWKFAA